MAKRVAAKEKPVRRTQEERREATRAALLDATIECLIDYGYANTTTTKVVERAGVSRGAQVHHFPTKAELVADAVARLADRRAEEIRHEADRLPRGRDRITAALDLLWRVHSDRLFAAALELWVAARTDSDLRRRLAPIEQKLIADTYEVCLGLFGEHVEAPEFAQSLQTAISAIQGLALFAAVNSLDSKQTAPMWARTRARLAVLFQANNTSRGKAAGRSGRRG